jgi:GTPase KRas
VAGQEEYSSLRDQYMRTGQGFIIVYDVTNRESFVEAGLMRDFCHRIKDVEHCPMVLVGNKIDLASEREVDIHEAESLARSWGVPFIETSCKLGTGVDEAVFALLRTMPNSSECSGEPHQYEPDHILSIKHLS